jgi:hypothetical protein
MRFSPKILFGRFFSVFATVICLILMWRTLKVPHAGLLIGGYLVNSSSPWWRFHNKRLIALNDYAKRQSQSCLKRSLTIQVALEEVEWIESNYLEVWRNIDADKLWDSTTRIEIEFINQHGKRQGGSVEFVDLKDGNFRFRYRNGKVTKFPSAQVSE